MFKKIIFFSSISIFFTICIYFLIGFYIAHSILRIDHSCGLHEGSLPNTWLTSNDYQDYKIADKKLLRKNFPSSNYYLNKWEDVYFPSRDKQISINGWLFNYHPNKSIVIVVHGIFPNGKCKPESNLIASLLIKNEINVLTIDLRNYGQSTVVGNYENLGLSEYKDVLGAYDYLQGLGFKKNQIGLLGISLGSASVIFAAEKELDIKAVWLESSLAEFKMILKDEISRYGLPHDFSLAVSFAGRFLTGIDPTKLNPAFSLTQNKNYFFTHGDRDLRVLPHHFLFLKDYTKRNNINADFWFVKSAYHVDAMLMFPEEYGKKMKLFFEKNLNQ